MNNPERLRRKHPVRTGPNRNPTTYFRASNSWKEREPAPPQNGSDERGPSDSMDDVVTYGVKLGYEVIDKYLRQGKQVAEKVSNGSHPGNSNEDDWEKLVGNMLRLYRDMSGFWIDAIEVLMRSPEFLPTVLSVFDSNGKAKSSTVRKESNSKANGENIKVAIEFASIRQAQVTLDLQPIPPQTILHVPGLLAGDQGIPPLTDVTFRFDQNLGIPVLHLNIPEKQPSGTYSGAVVEKNTNEIRGTLCVRVSP